MDNFRHIIAVPGLGAASVGFDQVTIGSKQEPPLLEAALPVADLEAQFHKFSIKPSPPNAYYWTQILLTCTGAHDGLSPLLPHQRALDIHAVTEVEIALDFPVKGDMVAAALLQPLRALWKRRHRRGHIRVAFKPHQIKPPKGKLPYPTFYLEDGDASVRMKIYARKAKLPGGAFAEPVVRIEWTLTEDRIGSQLRIPGRTIADLASADLIDFVRRNLALAEIDLSELGRLFLKPERAAELATREADRRFMPEGMTALDYWTMRAGALFLMVRANRDVDQLGSQEWAETVALTNPAQVRGYLRELQRQEKAAASTTGKRKRRRKWRFSDHRIRQIIRTKKWDCAQAPVIESPGS